MASNLCIGTLVRVKDKDGIATEWRGQLALIVRDDDLRSRFNYLIRRLSDGKEATCGVHRFDVASEESDDA